MENLNLIYGVKLVGKRLYVEEVDELGNEPQIAYVDDRNYVREWAYKANANRVKVALSRLGIESEVIVLRERC